jgi:hypothetical protein
VNVGDEDLIQMVVQFALTIRACGYAAAELGREIQEMFRVYNANLPTPEEFCSTIRDTLQELDRQERFRDEEGFENQEIGR